MRTRIHENFLLSMEDGSWNVYAEDGSAELIGNYPTREAAVLAFLQRAERDET